MKTKPVLIIIATLIIGFVTGFLTNGQITKTKIDKFVKSGTHEGFKGMYYRVLQPDEEQLKVIDPILDKYGELIHENVTTMQKSMKELHQQMVNEITPYLDQEQKERLEESIKRFERDERLHRGRKGPPPVREPGHRGPRDRQMDRSE
ncbi:MAG: hypothetical protein IH598_09885 [Bacteroidales bacterium]|nr:hypothetical protein [Bacteroidales bacterium]